MLSSNLHELQTHTQKKEIRNWVWRASVVTILVCFPVGIVGLIYSIISRVKLKKEDYDGAKRAAGIAGKWTIAAFIIGMVYFACLGIYYIVDPEGFREVFL